MDVTPDGIQIIKQGEGAWMTKYNGVYYLQYSVPGTQSRSHCDGVYTSNVPIGPFVFCPNSPINAKPCGFVTGMGHGCVFQDLSSNYWKADAVTILVTNMLEYRLAVFPAGFDGGGILHCDTTLADFP
jgi:beta-xylosidase